ncbi:MAG TPA: hypothetical protein VGF84_21070 [Micromonosporaceae bacterium]|jgi:hypothetical protein
MRFDVAVEATYLGGRVSLPDDARAAMATSLTTALGGIDGVTLTALAVDAFGGGRVRFAATLAGRAMHTLTSPMVALAHVDTAIASALVEHGLFEEFDFAQRSLSAGSAA